VSVYIFGFTKFPEELQVHCADVHAVDLRAVDLRAFWNASFYPCESLSRLFWPQQQPWRCFQQQQR
jgi:hypothetical protein